MRVCERPSEYEATVNDDGTVTVTDVYGKSTTYDRDAFVARFCAAPSKVKVPQ